MRQLNPRSAAPALLSLACVLAFASCAGAQPDEPDGAPVFAETLDRARESGALSRALGHHGFLLMRTYWEPDGTESQERWMTSYLVELDEERDELVVTCWAQRAGWEAGNTFVYAVSLVDGRLAALETQFTNGTVTVYPDGEGNLEITRALQSSQLATDELAEDGPQILPKIVGVFVLPQLFDQGLPGRLLFKDVTPYGQVTGPRRLRRLGPDDELASPASPEHGRLVSFCTDEGYAEPTTIVDVVAEGPAAGRLVRFRTRSYQRLRDGTDRLSALWDNTLLSPEEFRELRADLFPGQYEDE
jgi:hypothetical protein